MSPRTSWALAVAFVGLLCLPLTLDVLAWNMGLELPGLRRGDEVAAVEPGEWRTGAATAKADRILKSESLLARLVAPRYNALLYRALGRTAPAARVADDGWIFATTRTQPLSPARYAELPAIVTKRVLADVAEVTAEGARVVLVVVPDRARLHSEHAYPSGVLPAKKDAYLPAVIAALRRAGLVVFEVEPALQALKAAGGEPFYRADHHWTSKGAAAAMKLLARSLEDWPVGRYCETDDYRPLDITWISEVEERSLVASLGFPLHGVLEQQWGREYPRAVVKGRPARPDPEAKIIYVSTSYANYGGPSALANALRCPVTVAARNGNSLSADHSLLRRIRRKIEPSAEHLVIWELLEYDLYSAPGVELGRQR